MSERFFDVHTHLNLQFDDDWREVGRRALASGVRFVNVGTDEASSRLALKQAEFFEAGVWATVGLHPHDANVSLVDWEVINELAKNDLVVAIGECGLDYFKLTDDTVKNDQREIFTAQIALAVALGKPLMIHCRSNENEDAHADLWQILNEFKQQVGDKLQFNMHFFTGPWEAAKRFLDLDGYLSFPGVITFPPKAGQPLAGSADETIRQMPLNRMMSETDAPFAAPTPYRGQRNEPAFARLVAERLTELRSEPHEAVLEALVVNAEKFFNISKMKPADRTGRS